MTPRTKLYGALLVFIVVGQNYESQVSHLTNAQIAQLSVHDWFGALLNVAVAGCLAWKAYLADSRPNSSP